jgi:hypothetical protein
MNQHGSNLVPWSELDELACPPRVTWFVFEFPGDETLWRRGLYVTGRMNLGRLRGAEFALPTQSSRNMTLSRRLPGRRVLKILCRALDRMGLPRAIKCPDVDILSAQMMTIHGPRPLVELESVFRVLLWVWGPPS